MAINMFSNRDRRQSNFSKFGGDGFRRHSSDFSSWPVTSDGRKPRLAQAIARSRANVLELLSTTKPSSFNSIDVRLERFLVRRVNLFNLDAISDFERQRRAAQ
jgi:hypothetical protein